MIVNRKELNFWERLYLPAIIGGFKVTREDIKMQKQPACILKRPLPHEP
jgi:hypothetical protein